MGQTRLERLERQFFAGMHAGGVEGGNTIVEGLLFVGECREARAVASFVHDDEGVHMVRVNAGGRVWVRNVANSDVLVVPDDTTEFFGVPDDTSYSLDEPDGG